MANTQAAINTKMLVCDVDGTLTDGTIFYSDGNIESKGFSVKDGLGIRLAIDNGLNIVWLTGRSSAAVARRAQELGVEVAQGASNKDTGLREIAVEHHLLLEEIAYIGDDLNDIPALAIAGLPIAVAGSATQVLDIAAYVTTTEGGKGAVREAIEFILEAQGRLDESANNFVNRLTLGDESGQ